MYNTNFLVKYYTIKHELLDKFEKQQLEHIFDEPNVNEYGYTKEDILLICDKLYRDELLSVLGLDTFFEDKMIETMEYVYNNIMTNIKFKLIITEITNEITNELIESQNITIDLLILISLFSEQVFYITHKCICQHITSNTIDDSLLVDIRNALLDYFTKST